MGIKIDFNDTINKTVGVARLGAFWRGTALPDNLGPALSFMLVLGLLPAVGILIQWILIFPIRTGFFSFQIVLNTIVQAVLVYAFYVIMPPVMGAILAALDPALNINKGSAPGYATILAYSFAPAAVGSFLAYVLAFIPFLNIIGWLILLVLGILALAALYFGLVEGLGLDSGNAIIMLLITLVVVAVVYALVFYLILGSLFGGMFWAGYMTGF